MAGPGVPVRVALPIIVVSQFLATALWFSVNSAAGELQQDWGIGVAGIGLLTGAVQLGFILGTLVFALTGMADRYPASRIFASCALVGALANGGFVLLAHGLFGGMAWRFVVGLALAGVYPLGMKLIVRWAPEHASRSLAWLVGMLCLGTALPQGLRALGGGLPWQWAVLAASGLALGAAALVLWLGDGPGAARARSTGPLALGRVLQAFALPRFRASALGYFGHMWELYAFWTLVPVLVERSRLPERLGAGTLSGLSFFVIGAGALGCLAGGEAARRLGSARVAALALALSALCCLVYPWAADSAPTLLLGVLLVWGLAVVADSPQFSALSASACPPELMGSALAIQNSIGFAITVLAIQQCTQGVDHAGAYISWWLLPGPVLGLIALYPVWRREIRPDARA